ncbi:unnamed protein product [Spirodela intermedia]|uniref:malate dehydrogenase n=1 Tax=Spirodela intermedia TaxID=51605 RepID=A0A7I8J9K5_SPIIN|nr:unnamed protein product [Spirodela intermedia]CAA6666445.1 unnamed protein product [Spirodela intermedia]
MAKDPVRVLVTGAAVMLGADQPIILHMLDIPPAAEALNGVKMELIDAAFPLLKACSGVSIAAMVGGFPRKEGMERKDVMSKNVSIYKSQASALEQYAAANCKVLVVANPANTTRKLSSALSAASAACDHIHDWVLGTPEGTGVSMGIYSNGSYNVPPGLLYSFPVTCRNGDWFIVQGLPIDEFSRKKMDATAQELTEEKTLAYSCLS